MAEFFSALVMVVLVASSVATWWRIFSATKNNQPHCLRPRESKFPPLGFLDVLAAILFTFSCQVFALILAAALTGISDLDFDDMGHMTVINLSAGTAQLIGAGITLWYLLKRYGDIEVAGLQPGSIAKDLKLGFFGFLLFVPPMLILQGVLTTFWEYEHPTMEMVSPDSPLLTIVSAWWVAIIVAPFSEEVMFRVILLGWFIRCFAYPNDFLGGLIGGPPTGEHTPTVPNPVANDSEAPPPAALLSEAVAHQAAISDAVTTEEVNPDTIPAIPATKYTDSVKLKRLMTWAPVFIVALLFALVHIGQGPAPIPIFFLALGLCYIYQQTGSVVPCIATHFLLNTFSMVIFTLEQFVFPQEESLGEEGLAVPAGIVEPFASFFSSMI